MSMIEQIVKDYILRTVLQGEDASALTSTTPLITSGILDSLATLELVGFLESQFGIELDTEEADPTRLGTLSDIARLVEGKGGASGIAR